MFERDTNTNTPRIPMPQWAKDEGWAPEAWAEFMTDADYELEHRSNDCAEGWPSIDTHGEQYRSLLGELSPEARRALG